MFFWLHVDVSYQGGPEVAPSPDDYRVVDQNGVAADAHNANASWPPMRLVPRSRSNSFNPINRKAAESRSSCRT